MSGKLDSHLVFGVCAVGEFGYVRFDVWVGGWVSDADVGQIGMIVLARMNVGIIRLIEREGGGSKGN